MTQIADLVRANKFSQAIDTVTLERSMVPDNVSMRGYDLSEELPVLACGYDPRISEIITVYDELARRLELVSFSLRTRLANPKFDAPIRYAHNSLIALLTYAQNPVPHKPDANSTEFQRVNVGLENLDNASTAKNVPAFDVHRKGLLSVNDSGFGYEHAVHANELRDRTFRDVGILKVSLVGFTDLTKVPASAAYYRSEVGRFLALTRFALESYSLGEEKRS
ncbi:MAG TPA: hypothetical protein VK158_01615 [Acidobacteriota bacterium]|nr:hypothetical protein [Acidobacteriota bacterium]